MNLQAVADLLGARIGLDPASLGSGALRSAVDRRMQAVGLRDFGAYLTLLLPDGSPEFDELAELVVVPESWFFRGSGVFRALAGHLRQAAEGKDGPARALSVPCAAGEEPYSLAIILAEAGVAPGACSIDAVDLSTQNLERAKAGRYSAFAFRETPAELRSRYFREAGGGWDIDPALRTAVRFRRGNLADSAFLAGEGPFDAILCRNVLIYLRPAARERCLGHLDRLLAPQGLLAVGHAEPQLLLDRGFTPFGEPGLFLFSRVEAPVGSPAIATVAPRPRPARAKPAPPVKARLAAVRHEMSPPAAPAVDAFGEARSLADAGRLAEALTACLAVLRTAPSADGYSLLGVIHQARQEFDDATRAFRQALYLRPEHPEALLHLMLLYEQRGEARQAALLRRRLERQGGELP